MDDSNSSVWCPQSLLFSVTGLRRSVQVMWSLGLWGFCTGEMVPCSACAEHVASVASAALNRCDWTERCGPLALSRKSCSGASWTTEDLPLLRSHPQSKHTDAHWPAEARLCVFRIKKVFHSLTGLYTDIMSFNPLFLITISHPTSCWLSSSQ